MHILDKIGSEGEFMRFVEVRRKVSGISINELCEKSGISRVMYWRLRIGKSSELQFSHALSILKVLGLEMRITKEDK